MKISLFKNPIKNVHPYKDITLNELYKLIVSDELKPQTLALRAIKNISQAKSYKAEYFEYVTPNGVFSKRGDNNLISLSGYFVLDLDHLAKLNEVRERLIKDIILNPSLVFISPSGDGLKIFVRIDPDVVNLQSSLKKMQIVWSAINCYFSKHYSDLIIPDSKNNFIDPSGSDLSRACFICYDENAYFNPDNQNVLGKDFIQEYPQENKVKTKRKNNSTKVSHLTTISDLAERHLKEKNNHHPELVAFISAANKIDTDIETLLQYIRENVHISPESSDANLEKLEAEIHDIYSRYPNGSDGVILLTPVSFVKDILLFKYCKDGRGFILHGLYYDGIRQFLHNAGFAKRYIGKDIIYVQLKGCIISEVSTKQMRDVITQYVEKFDKKLSFKSKGESYQIPSEAIREIYLKNSNNIFNLVWLEHLQTNDSPILKDTDGEIFLPFKNTLVKITAEGIFEISWNDLKDFCVWEDQIIDHNIKLSEEYSSSHFATFLHNVTSQDESRFNSLVSAIGYLMHNFFRESEGQAVILYDEEITDTSNPQGRTGKTLIVNAIAQVRVCVKIDGKHFDSNNKFRNELVSPKTQVVCFDDVKKDFDFSVLHSNLTDGWTIEMKFRSQIILKPSDSPKTVITSNSVIKGGGTTNIGRKFPLELSNYYSKKIIYGHEKPIEDEHNGLFFSKYSWDADEWNKFYSLMASCASIFLQQGLIPIKSINIDLNRFRQGTNDDFANWCQEQNFAIYNSTINNRYFTKDYFEKFSSTYYGEHSKFSQRNFTNWIKKFAFFKGWDFTSDQSNGQSYFIFTSKRV